VSIHRLRQAFIVALRVPEHTDFESLSASETVEWDSVGQMELVAEIEGAFGVTLTTDDMFDLDSFAKARQILGRHGVDLSG